MYSIQKVQATCIVETAFRPFCFVHVKLKQKYICRYLNIKIERLVEIKKQTVRQEVFEVSSRKTTTRNRIHDFYISRDFPGNFFSVKSLFSHNLTLDFLLNVNVFYILT